MACLYVARGPVMTLSTPTETSLKAIVSADVAGYSLKMRLNELSTDRRVRDRLARISDMVVSADGDMTNPAGDGFIAYFGSVLHAVEFAVEMQKYTEASNDSLDPREQLRFRVGLHMGEVILSDDGISGTCVNIADRIQKLSEPGDVVISGIVYEVIESKLPFGFQCLGEKSLKGISTSLVLYRVLSDINAGSYLPNRRPFLPHPVLPSRPSLVVLPFENMSDSSGTDYFANGVTEDLITHLSRFRDLFIIARDSAFAYVSQNERRPSVKQIGIDFGVRYVLTGSIRWAANDRVRISAHLEDARNELQVWSGSYDRAINDAFAVQDEVTGEIASLLSVKIEASERHLAVYSEPENQEAYYHYMRGQAYFLEYASLANRRAREHFEQAIEFDPGFARAYGALAKTYGVDWRFSWGDCGDEALDRALELAQKAVALDNADSRGHSELGFVYMYKKRLDLALREYETALSLNPNDADVMAEMADVLVYAGRSEEAVELLLKAMRLNPFFPDWYLWYLGGAYFQLEQFEEAVLTLRRMINPTESRRLLAASYAYLGLMEEAQEQARLLLIAHPDFTVEGWRSTQPFINPAGTERLLGGLRKAGLP